MKRSFLLRYTLVLHRQSRLQLLIYHKETNFYFQNTPELFKIGNQKGNIIISQIGILVLRIWFFVWLFICRNFNGMEFITGQTK